MLAVLAVLALVASCTEQADSPARIEVVAEGLVNPLGMASLPDGRLVIAEAGTGVGDDSAGISLLSGRRLDRIVSGLPSERNAGDLAGVFLVGVSPNGETLYTSFFEAGGLLTFPVPSERAAAAGARLGPGDLGKAMAPLNLVEVVNAFDIAFTGNGAPVVTDATENGVAVENSDGTTRFLHRFGQIADPEDPSLRIDAVPTGIARIDHEFYVTLTGGCPYPPGAGRLVAIDGERGERVVADGLDMPIDVARGPDGTVWVLEFARFEPGASCFTGEGYQSGTGRLSRFDGGRLVPVVENLDFPGAVLPADDGSIYVSEVFSGRILRVSPDLALSELTGPPARPWRFTEVAADVGLDFSHGAFRSGISADPVAMMGGGLCWVDYDGDRRLDLYLVNSHALAEREYWEERGGLPSNALFRNVGGAFEEVSEGSGADLALRGNGCVAADFDGDGDTDLYVTADGPNALLVNDGGAFRHAPSEAAGGAPEWSTAAAAGDVDGDGDLDLFVGSYIDLERKIAKPSGAFPQDYLGLRNHLFLNDGSGGFREAAGAAGIDDEERTLGALFTDVDGDGDLDLYVANDGQPNRMYENRSGEGPLGFRFVDVTNEAGGGDLGSGMGVAGGDYDGDGSFDLAVTNWEAELHALYRNATSAPGELSLEYRTQRIGLAGLGHEETGWGTAWADFDHDTDVDLLIAHGRIPISELAADAEQTRLYGNLLAEGGAGQLRDWTVRAGLSEVGRFLARGSALADFDDDGDLDLAISQIGGPAVLLRNESPPGNWLQVVVEPALPGTTVTAELADGRRLRRELYTGSSYLASEDPRPHFGLGGDDAVASLEVRWPDGSVTVVDDVSANQRVTIEKG